MIISDRIQYKWTETDRVITQSQIPLGTDPKNTIFMLFWPANPSNQGGKFKNSDFFCIGWLVGWYYGSGFPCAETNKQVVSTLYPRFMRLVQPNSPLSTFQHEIATDRHDFSKSGEFSMVWRISVRAKFRQKWTEEDENVSSVKCLQWWIKKSFM